VPVTIMDKMLPSPPVTIEQLKMLRLNNATAPDAAEGLGGHPLKDFRDGIDFIKIPLKQQKQHVMAQAEGKA
jgi:hypothetical protein